MLPKLTHASFIAFYLFCDPDKGVPPFHLVKPMDMKFAHKESGQKLNTKVLSEMKKSMHYVKQVRRVERICTNGVTTWTSTKAIRLYEGIQWKFWFPIVRGDMKRYEGILWKTYLNVI